VEVCSSIGGKQIIGSGKRGKTVVGSKVGGRQIAFEGKRGKTALGN